LNANLQRQKQRDLLLLLLLQPCHMKRLLDPL
jgi:hypothetical protein